MLHAKNRLGSSMAAANDDDEDGFGGRNLVTCIAARN